MSQVVRAYDRARDEDVALKILSGDTQAKVLAGEFRYIASLNHPGIVQVYDFGLADDGRAFFTMEILGEGDLSDVAERGSLGSMMRMVREVFRTLDFVHARGIVHGDLKPSNVMVNLTATHEHYPKLLDFGIAWERADQQHGGTVHFMAPELFARSPRRDHRSDLYAMGIVLYEMLTGDLPFDDQSMVRLAQHHLSTPPPDPRDLWPRMPGELAELILRLLEKRPDDRFQHGREVVQAIDAFLAKTQAPPSSRREAYVVADPEVSIAGEARFVGHRDVLDELTDAAAGLSHGHCVVVEGESGAGKTRLLNELRVAVQLRGTDYMAVHLGEVATPAHMLERLEAAIGAASDHAGDKRPITSDRAMATEVDRLILEAERLATLVTTLAKRRPLVFGLEGIDGLPAEATKVVRAFALGLQSGPVMLLTTTQDGDAPVARELLAIDDTKRVSLRRVSKEACADIVKSRLGEMEGAEAIVEHVYRESGGNPGAIGRVVSALVASDAIVLRRDRWVVSAALGGQLPVLSAEAELRKIASKLVAGLLPVEREVAEAAANVGKQCEVALLNALVEVDDVREIVLALIASQVLEPVDDLPGQAWTMVAFTQRDVREVLLDGTAAVVGDHYSRRIVEILERWRDQGKPFAHETLARHLIVRDRIEEAAEVTFAGIQASPLPSAESVSLLRTALAATETEREGAERWCELAMQLAQIDLNEGRSELAIEGFSAVVERARGCAPGLGAAAKRELGDLLMARSDASGEDMLRRALDEARESHADELVGSAAYALANRLMLAGRHDEAKALLAEALEVADERSDDDLRARSLKLRATSNWMLGRFEEAEADARSAVDGYRRLSAPRGVAVSLGALANTLLTRGRIDEAQKAYEEALTYAHEAGWLTGIGKLESSLAAAAYHVDDWDTACEHLDAAAAILKRTGNTGDRLTALNGMGFIATKRGETIEARRLYDEALALARKAHYRKGEVDALSNLGELSLNMGAFAEADDYLEQALRHARETGAVSAEIETERRMLEADLARHRSPSDIAARAKALLARAEEASLGAEMLQIERITGIALARAHRPEEAKEKLDEVEKSFTKAGSRYEAARTVRLISELTSTGLLPDANHERALRSACRVFRRLRAQPELDAARRLRDRLGIAPSSMSVHAGSDIPRQSTPAKPSTPSVQTFDSEEEQPWVKEDTTEPDPIGEMDTDEDIDDEDSVIRSAKERANHPTQTSATPSRREAFANAPTKMAAPQLIDVGRELSEILELDELLASIVDAAIRTSMAQRGFVIACDNSGHPALRVSRGLGGLDLDDDLEMSRSAVGRVMATRQRVEWRKAAPPENALGESVSLLGLQALVALPLINRGRLWGVLYLDTRDPGADLAGESLPNLEALAAHAAVAIQNARLFEELGHKNELMAAAVNQLRHPLDALQRCAEVAHQQAQGTANERIIDTVRAHVRRMSVMVTRLLELATAEPSMVRASKVSVQVRDLVDAAVLQLRPLEDLDERPLELDVPWGLPTLLGDREQLIQVIASMLASAMRDTQPDGVITLRALATEPPMPDDDDPFFPPRDLGDDAVEVRVVYPSSGQGLGPLDELGLAIAREIVTHHDGTWETRTDDEGIATMTVVLPSLIADEGRSSRSAS